MAVRVGRPRGGRLGEEVRSWFWDALRAGDCVTAAARVAGVSKTSGQNWLAEAGGVIPRIDDDEGAGARIGFLERCRIEELTKAGWSKARIAAVLGRARSSIGRELDRCPPGQYRAVAANGVAVKARARPKPRKLEVNSALRAQVVARLSHHHSPEQVAHRLRRDFPEQPEMWVSHETIYQALYLNPRGELAREVRAAIRHGKVLRYGREQRRHYGRPADGRNGRIPGMINISERPAEAEDRAVPGHWEGDLIIGAAGRSAIGTTVERSTGFLLLEHLPGDHTAATVADAITTSFTNLPQQLRRSLTWDQGKEMSLHAQVTTATGMPVFFADPRSPWQRGSNENTNGLIREYFPKGTDLSDHDPEELAYVAAELNSRPRKRLDWETPAEVFQRLLSQTSSVANTP
ncbi:MAG: IS30 family transposase [Gammaproteobacteria bacterium]|nr:IS30 family transposase [Gammaproteobacteria bacterium]